MRSFTICTPHQYYFYEQMEEDEMVRACGTYGEEEKCLGALEGKHKGKKSLGRPQQK